MICVQQIGASCGMAFLVDCVWNVMAHAQKPDFVFRQKRTSPFKSAGTSVQSTAGSRVVPIRGSNAGYTMFRGSVKGTGYPLHSPVSPSLLLPCVTVCHHISTGLYICKRKIPLWWKYTKVGKAAIIHNNRCYFEKFYYNMLRLMYKQSASGWQRTREKSSSTLSPVVLIHYL